MSACNITGLYPTAFDYKGVLSILLSLITINTLELFILLDGICPTTIDHMIIYSHS